MSAEVCAVDEGQFDDMSSSDPDDEYQEVEFSGSSNLLPHIEDDIDYDYDYDEKYGDSQYSQFDETVSGSSSLQPRKKVLGQNFSKYDFLDMGGGKTSARLKDKADRATVSQVLDERTRVIISKLVGKGLFDVLTGSISMGKEANVFRAEKHTETGTQYFALKVYKTSILSFKQRTKYVEGDWRYHRGFCKSNPRKMVRTWAEKEIKNLTRIYQSGIPCPEPLLLKGHMLLMSFIGSEAGAAAPRLKDATLSDDKLRELYLDLILDMRKLYHVCHLIHADLSEFNILYHGGKAVIIDVSQSVEFNHPHAVDFLRTDCTNITEFFQNKGVATMTVKELFDFVTDPTINDDNLETVLDAAMHKAASRSYTGVTEEDKVEQEVFKNVFIPRALDQIRNHEREFEKRVAGETKEMFYQTLTGMNDDLTGAQEVPRLLEKLKIEDVLPSVTAEDRLSGAESIDDDDSGDETESEEGKTVKDNKRPRNETADERRERKHALKETRREKIKSKVAKHVKKRAKKLGKR